MGAEDGTFNRGASVLSGVSKAQILRVAQWMCGQRGRQGPWEGKEHGQQELPLGVVERVLAEVEERAVGAPVLSL